MNLLRLQTYIKISDFMPVLLKKSIRTSLCRIRKPYCARFPQGFKPMSWQGKQKKVCRKSCTPSFVLYLSDTAMILPLVSEERIILHRLIHLLTYTFDDLLVLRVCQHLVDEVGTEQHHVFLAATGRHCSRAEAQTACLES